MTPKEMKARLNKISWEAHQMACSLPEGYVPINDYYKLRDEMMQPHGVICPYCGKRFYSQRFKAEGEGEE